MTMARILFFILPSFAMIAWPIFAEGSLETPPKQNNDWAYLSIGASPLYFQSFSYTGKYWYDKHEPVDFGLYANFGIRKRYEFTPHENPNFDLKDGFGSARFGMGLGPYTSFRFGEYVLSSAILYEFYLFSSEFNGRALLDFEKEISPEIMIGLSGSYAFPGGPKKKNQNVDSYYYPYSDFNIELRLAFTFEKTKFEHDLAHKSVFALPAVAALFAGLSVLAFSAGGGGG